METLRIKTCRGSPYGISQILSHALSEKNVEIMWSFHKFLYFPHRVQMESSSHNLMWLILIVLMLHDVVLPHIIIGIQQTMSVVSKQNLNNEVILYVENAHRIKTIHSMWNFQCMSFYVETLHQFNNFFGRVCLQD